MAVDLGESAPDNGIDAGIEAEDVDAHLRGVGVGEFGCADVAALAGAVEYLHAAVVALERLGHEEGDGGWGFAEGGVDRRVGAGQQGVGGGGGGILEEGDAGDGEQRGKQGCEQRESSGWTDRAGHCAPAAARSIRSLHWASVRRPRQSCQPWNSPGAIAKGAPA